MQHDAPPPNAAAALPWLNGRPVALDFGGPTDVPFERLPPEWIDQPVIVRFQAIAQRFADRIAIDDGNTRLTYRQTRAAVGALAGRIAAATPHGGPVAALLENTSAYPVVFLACLMTGRPIVPVDLNYPIERQRVILRECGAVAIVLGHGMPVPDDLLPEGQPRIEATLSGGEAGVEPNFAVSLDAPGAVVYTSGSTGAPKGVAFSQRQMLATLREYINSCHINHHDRVLGLASLSGPGGREALAALLTGGSFHVSELRQSGVGGVFRVLVGSRPTIVAFVPSVLRSFAARADAAEAMASLRIVDLFGEQVTADAVAELRAVLSPSSHIRVTLGSAEAASLFHWFVPRNVAATGSALPCGYLAEDKSVVLLDEAGEPVEPGTAGELVVRGRHIASGMWRDGALVAGPFRQDPNDPASRILHTGDVVRIGADGLGEFRGRRDRRIKIRGLWADPGDVEAALQRIAGISDCVVVSRAGDTDQDFVAYVVLDAARVAVASIRAALRAELQPHLMPAEINVLDSIPRLPNFKPDLVALTRRGSVPQAVS